MKLFFVLLLTLFLVGCDNPPSDKIGPEDIFIQSCKATGESFDKTSNAIVGKVIIPQKEKYYVYDCRDGKKFSTTLIQPIPEFLKQ